MKIKEIICIFITVLMMSALLYSMVLTEREAEIIKQEQIQENNLLKSEVEYLRAELDGREEEVKNLENTLSGIEMQRTLSTEECSITECVLVPSFESTYNWEGNKRRYKVVECPLTAEQQDYIYSMCQIYDIDFYLFMALLELESDYNVNCISDTNDYGIAQINICNHVMLKEMLGFDDIMDFYTNIHCGLIMLRDAYNSYNDDHLALTVYNKGPNTTKKLLNAGYTTSDYSRAVMKRYDKIIEQINGEE